MASSACVTHPMSCRAYWTQSSSPALITVHGPKTTWCGDLRTREAGGSPAPFLMTDRPRLPERRSSFLATGCYQNSNTRRQTARIVIALLLGVLAALSPSTASAQEIRVGFFDATIDVEGLGANSYPGLSVGGSVPVAAAVPVSVYVRYNRDYGSAQKLTVYVVPSLQLGVAVRAVSMSNLAASL